MPVNDLPDWEKVLSAAARLQTILPDAVLVGGTAAAIYAGHRLSTDADHVVTDLRQRFDAVLAELESVAGRKTARINRPVLILGSLDGIETGIRQSATGGESALRQAFATFDELYPQPNGGSALQQLLAQISKPIPYDLEGLELSEYKDLDPRWKTWSAVEEVCRRTAILLLDGMD